MAHASTGLSTGTIDVAVPDIGNFKDVDVIEVLVKAGDRVEKEQALITLETDKATMDVPSPSAGVVKEVKVKAGDKVSQGSPILLLEGGKAAPAAPSASAPSPLSGEDGNSKLPSPQPSDETTSHSTKPTSGQVAGYPARGEGVTPSQALPVPAAASTAVKAHASPAIRRFAHELGVDLAQVKGSAAKGRITREDVQGYVKQRLAQPHGAGGLQVAEMPVVDFAQFGAVEARPLSRIRKLSGPALHRNWVNIPHVTQHDEADITELEAWRRQLNEEYAAQGVKITPLAFFLKAAAEALQQFPEFNASLDASGENLVLKKYFHIGVAVDTPEGLVVPVLRDVDHKGLVQLARELAEISAKARDRKISAAEMQGGSFTISSLGGIGGAYFTPIVNAPEVAILGVSRAVMKPVYRNGGFVPRLMLPLSLSYDHRVIDGAVGARFIVCLAQILADIRRLAL